MPTRGSMARGSRAAAGTIAVKDATQIWPHFVAISSSGGQSGQFAGTASRSREICNIISAVIVVAVTVFASVPAKNMARRQSVFMRVVNLINDNIVIPPATFQVQIVAVIDCRHALAHMPSHAPLT